MAKDFGEAPKPQKSETALKLKNSRNFKKSKLRHKAKKRKNFKPLERRRSARIDTFPRMRKDLLWAPPGPLGESQKKRKISGMRKDLPTRSPARAGRRKL